MLHYHSRRAQIAEFLPRGAVGAEIGVFRGQFSHPLGKATSPKRLYLIDPWWTLGHDVYPWRPNVSTRGAHQSTLDRMRWWIDRDIVTVLVRRSQDALAEMADAHLDWAYLDSSHDYEETLVELELLTRKVKPEGVISGHDFNTRRHPGVYRAITQFLHERPDYKLCYLDNHGQWAIRNEACARSDPAVRPERTS